MKLLRLELRAYGPFAGRTLDFEGDGPLVHVVYGPNEAGKSTTRRALSGLLFGIPERTGDAFRHDNKDLRIGGVLEDAAGERLHFVRRKGRKRTLLDPETGEPLEVDARLARFLRGVEREAFELAFSLDAARLREGGEALLRGGGDLGESLFDAGLGKSGVGALLAGLEDEAAALFKVNGKNPPLNRAIASYRRHEKAALEAALAPRAWEEQEREIERNQEELDQRREQRLGREAERKRLQRLRLVQGPLSALEELEVERRELRELGELPALVDEAGLERLEQDLLRFRTGRDERPRREAEAARAEGEAHAALERLRPGLDLARVEDLRPDPVRRERLREASERARELDAERRRRAEERTVAADLRERLEAELAALGAAGAAGAPEDVEDTGPLGALERALRGAHASLEERGRADERRREIERGRDACEAAARALPGLAVERLSALTLPRIEAVEALAEELARLREEGRRLDRERERGERERAALAAQASTEEALGELPSEARLLEARERRDGTWRRIRAGEPVEGEAGETLERELREADRLADRLRLDAGRVERAAARAEARERLAADDSVLEARARAVREERERADASWTELWSDSGLEPRSPKEMRAALQEAGQLAQAARDLEQQERELGLVRERAAERARLLHELVPGLAPDATLAEAVATGERHLAARLELKRRRTELRERAAQARDAEEAARSRLAAVERELEEHRADWVEAARTLGLDEAQSPREAVRLLDELDRPFQLLDRARESRERIAAIDAARDAFRAHVAAACGLGAEADDAELESAAARLLQRLRRAATLEEELAAADERLRAESDGHAREALRTELDAVNPDELPARIDALEEEVEELQEEIGRLNDHLGGLRAGLKDRHENRAAVEAAEAKQADLAEIHVHAARYMRLRTAALLLREEVERYREEHQAPVLRRAGIHFARLTLGGFEELRVGFDREDEPVLQCVRRGGELVSVEGLSHGTCDQLFLALRLASIEVLAKADPPLPLVCDDLLDAFDEERACAALAQLAELSSTTQVILFTHHERHLELAREAIPKARLRVHRLERGTEAKGAATGSSPGTDR